MSRRLRLLRIFRAYVSRRLSCPRSGFDSPRPSAFPLSHLRTPPQRGPPPPLTNIHCSVQFYFRGSLRATVTLSLSFVCAEQSKNSRPTMPRRGSSCLVPLPRRGISVAENSRDISAPATVVRDQRWSTYRGINTTSTTTDLCGRPGLLSNLSPKWNLNLGRDTCMNIISNIYLMKTKHWSPLKQNFGQHEPKVKLIVEAIRFSTTTSRAIRPGSWWWLTSLTSRPAIVLSELAPVCI